MFIFYVIVLMFKSKTNMVDISKHESRLRGRLLEKTRAIGGSALAGDVAREPSVADILPGLNGKAESSTVVMGGKATLVAGADITGAWHYSRGRVDQFTAEKAGRTGGKFGKGTYFGIGELRGETVDGLKAGGNIRHDVGFAGNILVVDRAQVKDVLGDLRTVRGLPQPGFQSSIQNGPVADLVEGMSFAGHPVNAVMVYMDPERQGAEMIVLPSATPGIRIMSVG